MPAPGRYGDPVRRRDRSGLLVVIQIIGGLLVGAAVVLGLYGLLYWVTL